MSKADGNSQSGPVLVSHWLGKLQNRVAFVIPPPWTSIGVPGSLVVAVDKQIAATDNTTVDR